MKRTDFCEPDCSCAERGEVLCCKLLPGVQEWALEIVGRDIDLLSNAPAIEALNALWLVAHPPLREGAANLSENPHVTAYVMEHYVTDHCTLCANSGLIDTRGVMTQAGVAVGRVNFCICPNGKALREVSKNGIVMTPAEHLDRTDAWRGISRRVAK